MQIETTTTTGNKVQITVAEQSITARIKGHSLKCSYDGFRRELKSTVGGKAVRMPLKPADASRIELYRLRQENESKYAAEIAEARRSGKRQSIGIELDDNMGVHRYYVTAAADIETFVETPH